MLMLLLIRQIAGPSRTPFVAVRGEDREARRVRRRAPQRRLHAVTLRPTRDRAASSLLCFVSMPISTSSLFCCGSTSICASFSHTRRRRTESALYPQLTRVRRRTCCRQRLKFHIQ